MSNRIFVNWIFVIIGYFIGMMNVTNGKPTTGNLEQLGLFTIMFLGMIFVYRGIIAFLEDNIK